MSHLKVELLDIFGNFWLVIDLLLKHNYSLKNYK